MKRQEHVTVNVGSHPPLLADRRRRPDRRQVSLRWLGGTLLTGLTSTALMGIALSAALDGHESASPPSPLSRALSPGDLVEKGDRVFTAIVPANRSRRTLEISTLVRDGDSEVIRARPFAYVDMALGLRHPVSTDYPAFDPLKIFSDDDSNSADVAEADTGLIYGTKVETEVTLSVKPFDFFDKAFDRSGTPSTEQAEELVRSVAGKVGDQPLQVASLAPVDAFAFDPFMDASDYEPGSAFRIVTENVSVAIPDDADQTTQRYYEEIIPFHDDQTIADAMAEIGFTDDTTAAAVARLAEILGTDTLEAGRVLRVGIENGKAGSHPVRLSVYDRTRHVLTVTLAEDGSFQPSKPPAFSQAVAQAFDGNATEGPVRETMPTVYDGIYQAALSYGLTTELCQRLLRILASDVDFQARLSPSDELTVVYSLPADDATASPDSEILYVSAQFGDATKTYYRFRASDGRVDYYDDEGHSSRQFLLRKPVPNARFSSGFSAGRRHPVLGYTRPHWGVDWAAPRGTPILAAGDGVVESAGWATGYGRETVIRHANGYETVYAHQSGFLKGLKSGDHVHQGEVIGYVGSTGLSTGNHLHFEIHVNGKRVDPMRIKLPSGDSLEGADLVAFEHERERVDSLLEEQTAPMRVAGR
ncbi:M23 family metallopeptidase [Consotaella aegiceratis]|uniref:M23 family metallopeptidase n=1 Tax=Consotaella aegiceratis TaxID=3097961 RepID=UPI002F3F7E8D